MSDPAVPMPEFPFRAPRENEFDFRDLFVLDLANNHQGSLDHGLRVIRETAVAVRERGVKAAIKFQFRDLDTFVHPAHQQGSDNKHIPRFLGTRLGRDQFARLLDEVRAQSLLSACTPFDETSAQLIADMGFDILKIASCSMSDWPLLAAVVKTGLPVIFSTGGATLEEIDNVVSYFEHRRVNYAIMHCVSIYPTPDAEMQLNQIDILRRRYPGVTVGFSTHEPPQETVPVQIAVAKGAAMFERHIGVATAEIKLNAYSSTPEQTGAWIDAWKRARTLCGDTGRPAPHPAETESLNSLKRGVYAARDLAAGETVGSEDIFFAMPLMPSQLSSGEIRGKFTVTTDVPQHSPVLVQGSQMPQPSVQKIFYKSIHDARALLNEARIAVGSSFRVEFSHHYGPDRFREVGAIIIDCVNRSYCKKLVIQFHGQRHPAHYHKAKEETFQVLHGILDMEVDGHPYRLYPGQSILIQQGVWHRFTTPTGVIFEEVSTTHIKGDSYYEDKAINDTPLEKRKTQVEHWGRFQIGNEHE